MEERNEGERRRGMRAEEEECVAVGDNYLIR
jgi:hypothetical protein